ncbi:MAG: TldD/PmbA family protein [Alphaproteobacteria bacterium]|nr:TldD/PmbA family protein [Alphaproteobacteria bacterium]MCB9692106.1 TldD/PmbA family protein [Alphaproteobacteria bacterium]
MSHDDDILDLAERVVRFAKKLGADEVACSVSEGSHVTIQRRGGKVEQATEASTRGLTVAVLCDDRFSSNSTSDLRPEALESFLERAVASTRYLEAEAARRQPDAALCGRGVSEAQLDQLDPVWERRTASDRASYAEALEDALRELHRDDVVSSAVYAADGHGRSIRVMSNGFSGEDEGAWFAAGGEMTLVEGDRRPESSAYFAARYLSDLPSIPEIAGEVDRRTRERLGAGPIASGTYTMLLPGRAAGRILGMLAGPLSGGSLQQHRSCLEGKLGERIGSERFTLIDDPTIPRGLGSRPWDGDAMRSRVRTIIEEGVLREYDIGVYHARKLGVEPTSGGRSNWVLPTGTRGFAEIAADLPQAIEVTGFLGGNSNGATGDFSLGIRGVLWEGGQPTRSLAEMNVSGNVLQIFHQLVETGDDPWTFASVRAPTLVFEGVQFSGT